MKRTKELIHQMGPWMSRQKTPTRGLCTSKVLVASQVDFQNTWEMRMRWSRHRIPRAHRRNRESVRNAVFTRLHLTSSALCYKVWTRIVSATGNKQNWPENCGSVRFKGLFGDSKPKMPTHPSDKWARLHALSGGVASSEKSQAHNVFG